MACPATGSEPRDRPPGDRAHGTQRGCTRHRRHQRLYPVHQVHKSSLVHERSIFQLRRASSSRPRTTDADKLEETQRFLCGLGDSRPPCSRRRLQVERLLRRISCKARELSGTRSTCHASMPGILDLSIKAIALAGQRRSGGSAIRRDGGEDVILVHSPAQELGRPSTSTS